MPAPQDNSSPLVLVVDDCPMDCRRAAALLEKGNFRTRLAANGQEALSLLKQQTPALVLTDLQMPEMNGLQLVEVIRERHAQVPVILMTAHGNEEIAFLALQKGAASYVPKQHMHDDLCAMADRIMTASGQDRRRQRILEWLRGVECEMEIENDPGMVSDVVTYFQDHLVRMGICESSSKVRVGIALEEALLNAIYHGNLNLCSDMRQDGSDRYQRLAVQRRYEEPYAPRRVRLSARLTADAARFVIRDEGDGFDVSNLPDPTDPENLLKLSGRGVLLIRMFMDEVQYNDKGNQVTMILYRKTEA